MKFTWKNRWFIIAISVVVNCVLFFLFASHLASKGNGKTKKDTEMISDAIIHISPPLVTPPPEESKSPEDSASSPPPQNVIALPSDNDALSTTLGSQLDNVIKPPPPPPPAFKLPTFSGAGSTSGIGSGNGFGSGKTRNGPRSEKTDVFGMDLGSSEEVVLLVVDASQTMKEYLPLVKQEIHKNFPSSSLPVLEVGGSLFCTSDALDNLKHIRSLPDYYLDYYSSYINRSIIPTITAYLSETDHPPTIIYFFTDFADYYGDGVTIRDFRDLLKQNQIRFFANSIRKSIPGPVAQLCSDTGGNYQVKVIDLVKVGDGPYDAPQPTNTPAVPTSKIDVTK